jgi:hypothetical protein
VCCWGCAGRGGGVDLSALCIVSGKTCWVLYVDALLLNVGGNLHDALSVAAKVRCATLAPPWHMLAHCRRPTNERGAAWWPRDARMQRHGAKPLHCWLAGAPTLPDTRPAPSVRLPIMEGIVSLRECRRR